MVRNLSKVYLGDVFSSILGVGSALILIRGLTIADYASFVAFGSIAYLSAGLVGTGMNKALVRFSAEYLSRTGRKPHSLYASAPIVEVAIFVVVITVSLSLPTQTTLVLLGDASFARPVQLGLLYGLGLLLMELGRSIYQAEERFTLYVGSLWMKQGLIFAVVVCLWVSQRLSFGAVGSLIAAVSIAVGIGVVLQAVGTKALVSVVRVLRTDKGLTQEFISATAWLMPYYLALAALGQIDVLILSRFASTEQFAVYGVARQYYMMGLLLLGAIHAVLLPKLSRVDMQDPALQRAFVGRWLRCTWWVAAPIVLFDAVAKPLFVWMNGPQYERSFGIFLIFSIGIWLSLMLSPLVNIVISRGDFRFLFLVGALALAFSYAGNYLLVPMFGGVGGAIVTVLTHNVVLQLPILWRVWR
jgi:O-antigen/teichoic acid export membrane protein